MILSGYSNFVSGSSPRHVLPSLLIILLLISLYGALGRDENCETHLPCICCKVKSQTSPERSVLLLDQKCASVWNVWWNYTPLFDMISSFYFETWLAFSHEPSCAHYYYFLFFWDLHVSHFFLFFCIALLSLSRNMLERSYF